jgi:hypothetical protein
MKKRAKLHLVGNDPADVFDNLDKLRAETSAPTRRPRTTETFARIPHDKGLALGQYKLGWAAWVVLIELDRLMLKAGNRNPVRLWSPRLRAMGVIDACRMRALRQLEAAGVVKVEQRGSGLSPWVTHLWFQLRD